MSDLYVMFHIGNWGEGEIDKFVQRFAGRDFSTSATAEVQKEMTEEAMTESFVGQFIIAEEIEWRHCDYPNTIALTGLTDAQRVAINLAVTNETLYNEEPHAIAPPVPVAPAFTTRGRIIGTPSPPSWP